MTDFKKIYDLTKEESEKYSLNGIRLINDKHVNEIYASIMSGATYIPPVEININTMGIIDGQHRFMAYKKAWDNGYEGTMEARFLDIPVDDEPMVIQEKNTHSKNWTITDFRRASSRNGNSAVIALEEFAKKHSLCHGKLKYTDRTKEEIDWDKTAIKERYAMAFLKGTNVSKELKENKLKISKDDIEYAESIYPEVERLMAEAQFNKTAAWFESFVQAWFDFRRDIRYVKRMNNVGLENYYKYVNTMDRFTTTSKDEWDERFKNILLVTEKAKLDKAI